MPSEDANTLQTQDALMLKAIANRLEGKFGDLFTRDTLQHYVDDSYAQLSEKVNRPARHHERDARHRRSRTRPGAIAWSIRESRFS